MSRRKAPKKKPAAKKKAAKKNPAAKKKKPGWGRLRELPLPSLADVVRAPATYGEPDASITFAVARLVRIGLHPDVACRAMGIPRWVARQWIERGIEEQHQLGSPYARFLHALDTADAQDEYEDVLGITTGVKHWSALAWKRERKAPTRWGSRTSVHLDMEARQEQKQLEVTPEEAESVLSILTPYLLDSIREGAKSPGQEGSPPEGRQDQGEEN